MRYWGPINSPGGIYGNDGYVDGNPGAGIEGSIPTFRTFEQMMRELSNMVVRCGLTPDDVMNGIQVAQSVQSHRMNFGLDTGTANDMAVTLSPPPSGYTNGLFVNVRKGSSDNNTTSSTLNVNGMGAKTCRYSGGQTIKAGELKGNSLLSFLYDATAGWFVLISLNMQSMLISIAAFGTTTVVYTSGSGNFVVPADVYMLREVELVGGGGGGGWSNTTTWPAAGGGNGGTTLRGPMAVTPGQSIAWMVGVGGAAGTSTNDGGNGGNTGFGGWIATAGKGGKNAGNAGDTWDVPTGGFQEAYYGEQGHPGYAWPADNQYIGGQGGNSAAGGVGGNGAHNGNTPGNPGVAPGGAAGGGSYGSAGNTGASGRILLRF